MSTVTIKDKTFVTFIPEAKILEQVKAIACRINIDMKGKNPLMLAVLNGSFMFVADLMKFLTISCEISFIRLSSYERTSSTGKIKKIIGLNEDLRGRHVVIVEDIIDTGLTMKQIIDTLASHSPASLHICTLLLKPGKLQVPLNIDYAVMEIPNDFIVGYGLDYEQQGRNLRDIYTLVK